MNNLCIDTTHIAQNPSVRYKKAGKTGKVSDMFGRYSVQISGGTANKPKFQTAHILT
jgi:ribosomal protein L21E